jgi:drug/metabolite transporter (DMT)-like permease
MDSGLVAGLALGISASLLMNIGKGVQKQKVQVLKKGREMFRAPNLGDFVIWLTGIIMTCLAAPLYSMALKFTDKSSLVSSLSGIGLVGLLIYAGWILKESIGLREIFSSALIITGTGIISYFNQPISGSQEYQLGSFIYVALILVLLFGTLAFIGAKWHKLWGFSFGLIAGSLIGLAMILGDMALVKSGGDFLGQLSNIYVYLALASATSALVLTQVAFFKGSAVLVVPTINSFIILTPLAVEYFTFGTALNLIQYTGSALIIIGIIILTTSPKQVFQAK